MRVEGGSAWPTPIILVVVGASGAGKTTLVARLAALGLPGVGCYHFDTIGVPSEPEIRARFGNGWAYQAWGLDQWLARFVRNEDRVRIAVLDAQVRPSAVRDGFARRGITLGGVVFVDCAPAERNARLCGPRNQPELANAQMDCWAAYLRDQADALGVPVIDTTGETPESALPALQAQVTALLRGSDTVERPLPMEISAVDSLTVRRAFLDDADAVAALNRDVQAVHAALVPEVFKVPGPGTLSEQDARQLLATPTNIILLALIAEVPIGYLYAEVRRRAETAYIHACEEIYLHHVSVRPSHQRYGVGTALIDAITRWGEEQGLHRIALDVWTANTAASAFFRSRGFVRFNERLARGGWGTTHGARPT